MIKKILLLISLILSLNAKEIVLYENSYEVLKLKRGIKEISVGNKKILNVSFIGNNLKLYGKGVGHTSILISSNDGSYEMHDVFINQNLSYLSKTIKELEPGIEFERVGNSALTIKGNFKSKKSKEKIFEFLTNSGIDTQKIIDLSTTRKVRKMIRTKLYLVEINNQRAEDLGGITGLGIMNKFFNVAVNPKVDNGATFSGFLLDHLGNPTSNPAGKNSYSITGTLNFLEQKGVAKILDDTVLMTTEDKNATFRVGGEVYIPIGLTENNVGVPTIQLEEKEYGLKLTLKTNFMKKEGFMHMRVDIEDSEFDTNPEHNVKLGEFTEVPSFVSKTITTEVVAKSGQLIALGGRLHTEKYTNKEKVPFLGDIPIVGEVFKHKVDNKKSNDLLFFLIPEIIDPNKKLNEKDFYKKISKESAVFHEKSLDLTQQDEKSIKKAEVKQPEAVTEPVEEAEAKQFQTEAKPEPVKEVKVEQPKAKTKPKPVKPVKKAKVKQSEAVTEPVKEAEAKQLQTEVKAKEPQTKTKPTEEIKPEQIEQPKAVSEPTKETKLKQTEQPKTALKPTKETKTTTNSTEQTNTKKYAVDVEKVFLRSNPVDGDVQTVWTKGHEFTIEESKKINKTSWLKVDKDCYKGVCKKADKEMWIAKKLTKDQILQQ